MTEFLFLDAFKNGSRNNEFLDFRILILNFSFPIVYRLMLGYNVMFVFYMYTFVYIINICFHSTINVPLQNYNLCDCAKLCLIQKLIQHYLL